MENQNRNWLVAHSVRVNANVLALSESPGPSRLDPVLWRVVMWPVGAPQTWSQIGLRQPDKGEACEIFNVALEALQSAGTTELNRKEVAMTYTLLNCIGSQFKRLERVEFPRETTNGAGELLDWIENKCLPSGSGVDMGTKIDRELSSSEKIVLTFDYHHMDEHGGYNGWSAWSATITPSLANGFDIEVEIDPSYDVDDEDFFRDVFQSDLDFILDSPWSKYRDAYNAKFRKDTA